MLKYLVLRPPQAMLILSFSLPLALALSLEPSCSGLINTSMLGLYGIGITADRVRELLPWKVDLTAA